MTTLLYVLLSLIVLVHAVAAYFIWGHCNRSTHSRYAWLRFLSDAPDIRADMLKLPIVQRQMQLYALWYSLKLTKMFTGVDAEQRGMEHGRVIHGYQRADQSSP